MATVCFDVTHQDLVTGILVLMYKYIQNIAHVKQALYAELRGEGVFCQTPGQFLGYSLQMHTSLPSWRLCNNMNQCSCCWFCLWTSQTQ